MWAGASSVLAMEPRVSLITLGVPDLRAARRFYVDGLGWTPTLEVPDEVVFIQVGHGLLLSLFDARSLREDAGLGEDAALSDAGARPGFTLAHNVGSEAEVDAVLAAAVSAGADIVKPAARASWGGYQGYFADPAGALWEVAYNPDWSVAPDGSVTIG